MLHLSPRNVYRIVTLAKFQKRFGVGQTLNDAVHETSVAQILQALRVVGQPGKY